MVMSMVHHGGLLLNGSVCSDVNQAQNVVAFRNKDELAKTLRQNWGAQFSDAARRTNLMNSNDDLTNLGWLQNSNLINMKITSTVAPLSPPVSPELNSRYTSSKEKFSERTSSMMLRRSQSYDTGVIDPHLQNFFADEVKLRASQQSFQPDSNSKPSFSFATLIWMCMEDAKQNKVTLTDIYAWIMNKFTYYQHADVSWKNLVRLELLTNKCFQKVVCRSNEPGHGRYWCINHDNFHFKEKNGIDRLSLPRDCNNNVFNKVSSPNKRKRVEPTLNKNTKHRAIGGLKHSRSCVEPLELPSINSAFNFTENNHNFGFRPNQSLFLDDEPNDVTKIEANELAFNYLFNGSELDTEHINLSNSKDRCMLAASLNYITPSPSSDGVFEDFISNAESESLSPPLDGDGLALDLTVYGQGLSSTNWCNNDPVSTVQAINLNTSFGTNFGFKFSQSPLLLDEDEDWINTQLGLEEFDSILEFDASLTEHGIK